MVVEDGTTLVLLHTEIQDRCQLFQRRGRAIVAEHVVSCEKSFRKG